jgi:hypothetical protein
MVQVQKEIEEEAKRLEQFKSLARKLGTCGKAAMVHNGIRAEIPIAAGREAVEVSRVD